MEAIRNGWHPHHPPRMYFERASPNVVVREIPIDPQWHRFTFPAPPINPEMGKAERGWHRRLIRRSLFYSWLVKQVSIRFPGLLNSFVESLERNLQAHYIKAVKDIPGYRDSLQGWNPPDDLGMDQMFFCQGSSAPAV